MRAHGLVIFVLVLFFVGLMPAAPANAASVFNIRCGDVPGLVRAMTAAQVRGGGDASAPAWVERLPGFVDAPGAPDPRGISSAPGLAGAPVMGGVPRQLTEPPAVVINLNADDTPDCSYVFTEPAGGPENALPVVNGHIAIVGHGATLEGGGDVASDTGFRAIAIANTGALTVSDLALVQFHTFKGGGILNQGLLSLSNCSVSNNIAAGAGGGIYNDQGWITINACTIAHNVVTSGNGGGIYNNKGFVGLTGSNVDANKAKGFSSGGGIFNSFSSFLTLNTTAVTANSAQWGGGLFVDSFVLLTDSTVLTNTAVTRGGGLYTDNGWTKLTRTVVGFNKSTDATGEGGGIWIGGRVSLDNSKVNFNTAGSANLGSGGGIFMEFFTSLLDISNASEIRFNSAGHGGGIDAENGQTVSIDGSSISNNHAYEGGGISFRGTIDISGSSIDSNTAQGDGGGLLIGASTATITNSSISGNTSANEGGGFFDYNSDITLTGDTIANNDANTAGGFFVYNLSTVKVTNTAISGNSAFNAGGGFVAMTLSDVSVSGGSIDNNTANHGGGIWNNIVQPAQITVAGVKFFNNSPDNCGGSPTKGC